MCENKKVGPACLTDTVKPCDCAGEASSTNAAETSSPDAAADPRFPRKAFCVGTVGGDKKQFTVFGPFETAGHAREYGGNASVVLPMIVPGGSQTADDFAALKRQYTHLQQMYDDRGETLKSLYRQRDELGRRLDDERVRHEGVMAGCDSLRKTAEHYAARHAVDVQLLQDIKAFLLTCVGEDNGPTVRGLIAQIDAASV